MTAAIATQTEALAMHTEDLHDLVLRIDERTKKTSDIVDQLHTILVTGNGEPAVTQTVARLDERVGNIETVLRDSKLSRVAWAGIAVSLGLGVLEALHHLL
jgi:hypothetical protein